MASRKFPTDILSQAIEAQAAWSEIDEEMIFGTLNMGALATDIKNILTVEGSLATLEAQLTEIRDQRDDFCGAAWDKVKRVRAGVKANFGDDSTQYNMIGGTRVSDRKAVRKSPLPAEQA